MDVLPVRGEQGDRKPRGGDAARLVAASSRRRRGLREIVREWLTQDGVEGSVACAESGSIRGWFHRYAEDVRTNKS